MFPRLDILAALTVTAIGAACAGCERSDAHPAEPALQAFLDAVQYQDFEGALGAHVEGTGEGVYCTAAPFVAVFDQARRAANPAECERLVDAGEEALSDVDDETRLLLQIVDYHCRHPEGSCADYARRLYRLHLVRFAEQGIRGYAIRKVIGDGARAVGYVDLRLADGQTLHRAVRLRSFQGSWRVEEGLLDVTRPDPLSPPRPEATP